MRERVFEFDYFQFVKQLGVMFLMRESVVNVHKMIVKSHVFLVHIYWSTLILIKDYYRMVSLISLSDHF